MKTITFLKIIFSYILISCFLSCNGQSEVKELEFEVISASPVSTGEWLFFTRKFDFKKIEGYSNEAKSVLLSAKRKLIADVEGEDVAKALVRDSLLSKKIDYMLAYGVKVNEDYLFRWERTGPVLPKYFLVELKKNDEGQWEATGGEQNEYFKYLSSLRGKWHQILNAPIRSKDGEEVKAIKTECQIEGLSYFAIDCNCLRLKIDALSPEEIAKMFAK